ncbi:metalloregulator ArsR/SmtB family transcription factor [Sinomonas sp. ASV486]|uniref:ArsR/SmtB family transcription factor n=1 Tax=Sinomonas sp. ASV486 TaxID=3051170 RepID=UPI0027DBA4D6|nr:metalloregulator ArsR/SmtB family transcription factor [Sinomonas sp. ASV486]MDQ4492079.1 metalloregulator ArsR/SmtB family transcription factor [Sinomonas sp. ASV486]
MVTDIFAVIADRTRRDILDTLRTGDKAVGELVEALSASQPTVSKHLKVLRDAGLVTTRAQGQKRFYALRVEPLGEVGGWIAALRTTPGSPAAAAVPPGAVAEPEETTVSGEEAALVPAAVVPHPGESHTHESHTHEPHTHEPHTHEGGTEASRPAQIQRSVERTVERAAARATELMANLPKFGRRK